MIMSTLACQQPATKKEAAAQAAPTGSFAYDRDFILKHDTAAITLGKGQAQLLISAKYQAKVFTSTAAGDSGRSLGWIHYKAFEGPLDQHMNAYGGENRFWFGPEGGKFSVFFPAGAAMTFDNWKTPAAYDSEAWDLVSKNDTIAVLKKDMHLQNYAGSKFSLRVDREIQLLNDKAINSLLNVNIPAGVKSVGYRTKNTVTNTGDKAWDETTGMPCTWILDMFPPSDSTTIVIPYKAGKDKPATTNYFGEIPADRIKMDGQTLFFKADGKQRGKLGIHPDRVKTVGGSYDAVHHVLTIILFDTDPKGKYLNQEWRTDRPVFSGDAMNAYNDGPLADGKQMGPFYELESVSSALFLAAGQGSTHLHSVFHFTGDEAGLNVLAEKILNVNLSKINKAF